MSVAAETAAAGSAETGVCAALPKRPTSDSSSAELGRRRWIAFCRPAIAAKTATTALSVKRGEESAPYRMTIWGNGTARLTTGVVEDARRTSIGGGEDEDEAEVTSPATVSFIGIEIG